jgi:hypothetical protein
LPNANGRKKLLTLENICVMGLVTLMLSKPATHRRNPKNPVTIVPHTNTFAFQFPLGSVHSSKTLKNSPWRRTKGATKAAEPRLVQYARWMVELLQWGREDLIRTEWTAMKRAERMP